MKPQQNLALTPTLDSLCSWIAWLAKVLAGNVSFGTTTGNSEKDRNIDCWKASGATPVTPDTQFTVAHQLGRIPIGWILVYADQPVGLYASGTAWTKTDIYLKCSVASMNYVLIVI